MRFLSNLSIILLLLISLPVLAQEESQDCVIDDDSTNRILKQVEKKNPNAVKILPECFKLDRKLMVKIVLLDASQFQYANNILKEDEIFIRRLIKVNPAILQFASDKLRSNQFFMQHATYLSRDALQYANPKILNNILFMKKMIDIDSKNYIFASNRLKKMKEFAAVAFADNGTLLAFAPKEIRENKELVTIAIKSNGSAMEFASEQLQKDPILQKLAQNKTSITSKEELKDFLQKNYTEEKKKKHLGMILIDEPKFFKKNQIINRNYITKWQRSLDYSGTEVKENTHLITTDSRNYQIPWRQDFTNYPGLSQKIEKFLVNHDLDKNTIDSLSTLYLWKIKDKPLTLAFNLYFLRDSNDIDLGSDFVSITSLTAIVQKQGGKWHMTVVDVIFDSETKVDITYKDGHMKRKILDLYTVDKKDKNPKIIFKVSDQFSEYLEIFEEQNGGKYQMVYRVDLLGRK